MGWRPQRLASAAPVGQHTVDLDEIVESPRGAVTAARMVLTTSSQNLWAGIGATRQRRSTTRAVLQGQYVLHRSHMRPSVAFIRLGVRAITFGFKRETTPRPHKAAARLNLQVKEDFLHYGASACEVLVDSLGRWVQQGSVAGMALDIRTADNRLGGPPVEPIQAPRGAAPGPTWHLHGHAGRVCGRPRDRLQQTS